MALNQDIFPLNLRIDRHSLGMSLQAVGSVYQH